MLAVVMTKARSFIRALQFEQCSMDAPVRLLQQGRTAAPGSSLTRAKDSRSLTSRFERLKLYASVDQGPSSKHAVDLRKLAPSPEELGEAAAWCRTHDPSEGFAQQLQLALQALGGDHGR